jgi:hypothetical protein
MFIKPPFDGCKPTYVWGTNLELVGLLNDSNRCVNGKKNKQESRKYGYLNDLDLDPTSQLD